MTSVLVVCPSPSCPGRSVQGQEVIRASWDATWHEADHKGPGEWAADIHCDACSTEGIDPESGQLDSAEEELGVRCPGCGVVSSNSKPVCPHCGLRESQWETA